MKKRYAIPISLLITAIFAANIFFFSSSTQAAKREKTLVARVIDGDTIDIGNKTSVRLANINTPEKKESGSNLGADYLRQFINRTIDMESLGKERYGRTLARFYSTDIYINLELVSRGYANKYLVQKSEKSKFAAAEKQAIEQGIGIWKHSQYYGCFQSAIDAKREIITLTNTCQTKNAALNSSISLEGWQIKDEGRTRYKIPKIIAGRITIHSGIGNSTTNTIYLNSKSNIWNDDADTFYLFDSSSKIAHTYPYGY